MKFLHDIFDGQRKNFEKGGKFEKFFYVFEAAETFHFTPPTVAPSKGAHIRDAVDLKRLMITVVVAMVPCLLYGMWNVGHQHFLATGQEAALMDKFLLGLQIVLPIVLVSYTAGGIAEAIFAVIRKHPINEGFLVTGMLIPLVVPPTIPLWQVAIATIFSVVIAKEAFGGTGMNILNVALTARAFLYFGFPQEISGDVWTFFGDAAKVDGFSGATVLAIAAATKDTSVVEALNAVTWAPGIFDPMNLFMGAIPGSIGETSTLACILGALILIGTGVGSWQIIVSVFIGGFVMGSLLNMIGGNPYMMMPAYYHLIIGGFAFGAVFMATDPVTAAQTSLGKWIYGFMIGVLTVIIRVFNEAYPEGIMLAILLMNVLIPVVDYLVINANKKRRLSRATL